MSSIDTRRRLRQLLTVVLLVALVASAAGVAYVASTPDQTDDAYTELYLLGPSGVAADYPTELSIGESGAFSVGITNNEHIEQTYTVAILDGAVVTEDRTVEIDSGESWQEEFTVSFDEPGNHEVRVVLFVGESVGNPADPYRQLRFESAVRP